MTTLFPENPSNAQIADACMWSRHDFGLLTADERRQEMHAMKEHWRAIWKAVNTPGKGSQYDPDATQP